jgi:hypothetical protein
MNPLESELQSSLLLAAPRALPRLRLFRRNIGAAKYGTHTVTFGTKGMADLWGYWRGGRAIELELKTATGVSSKEQKAWAAFCRAWGVSHLVLRARDGETIAETVARWLEEIALTDRQSRLPHTGQ